MTKWAFVFVLVLLVGSGATRAHGRTAGTLVFFSQRDPSGGLYAESGADPPGGPNESRLMTIGPNGTGLRLIAHRVYFASTWSPDSTLQQAFVVLPAEVVAGITAARD